MPICCYNASFKEKFSFAENLTYIFVGAVSMKYIFRGSSNYEKIF